MPDFGLFYVNTHRYESIWLAAGVGPVVWGADWFTHKMERSLVPFTEAVDKVTSARWLTGLNLRQIFNTPLDLTAGAYVRYVAGYSPRVDLLKTNPEFLEYGRQSQSSVALGGFYTATYAGKRLDGYLNWVPGVGDWRQPGKGLLNFGVKALQSYMDPWLVGLPQIQQRYYNPVLN